MKRKPDIRDMELILERIRREKTKNDNPNPDLPKAAPASSFKPIEPADREPGEDENGINGEWSEAWSLADWVEGAKGDFRVRTTITGIRRVGE